MDQTLAIVAGWSMAVAVIVNALSASWFAFKGKWAMMVLNALPPVVFLSYIIYTLLVDL